MNSGISVEQNYHQRHFNATILSCFCDAYLLVNKPTYKARKIHILWKVSQQFVTKTILFHVAPTYVSDIVLKGAMIKRTRRVRLRARNHATFQNDI